jgi:hypothetical protein
MSDDVIAEIAAERKRQIEVEGWTRQHDADHIDGELALAASAYAYNAKRQTSLAPSWWPFNDPWWKPKTPRRDLIRAAALIVAEIERIDRASPRSDPQGATDEGRG